MNEVRNIIVGFDIGEKVSQLCYYDRHAGEPVSIPMKVGTGQYTFPNCLSKKPGEEEWHFGLEVEYFVSQQEEIYLDNLYEVCSSERTVMVDGQEREAGELLGIFIKNALRILGVPDPVKSISGLMLTTPKLTKAMVENIRVACQYMGFSRNRCFLQDYEESFYFHTLYQKAEIWSRNVALFSFDQDEVSYAKLEMERKTKPIQVRVKRGKRISLHTEAVQRDFDFYELIQESMGTDVYSSIFLVGEGFDKEWAVRSVPLLCRHQRHVFYGNNLFAKGACYAAKEKVEERNLKGYLYTGNDMVRLNVGMDMMVFGTPAYHPLISAGVNWYEAMNDCELILDDTQELTFVVTNMDNTKKERYSMPLPNLPDRPSKATRLHLHLEFESANKCRIDVEDMGFGEMYPSSGLVWHETMVN
ncbi:MAG: hypothetical protein EOM40_09175 [Clostridia bacterium]|nr:hypothetical protein [Clostridia bacterium]NCC44501.1 hypothetical protein [Clostridia bacterium]